MAQGGPFAPFVLCELLAYPIVPASVITDPMPYATTMGDSNCHCSFILPWEDICLWSANVSPHTTIPQTQRVSAWQQSQISRAMLRTLEKLFHLML
jgi:hypothetical protein